MLLFEYLALKSYFLFQLTDLQREILKDDYSLSGTKRAVELRLLNFISYNSYHLPMYAKPSMV